MNPEQLKELGLSPVWRDKKLLQVQKTIRASTALAALPAAAAKSLKNMQWTPLREHVRACTLCALAPGRTQTVFGDGVQIRPDIFIVGEGPGQQEDEQGEPFVGRAGKLLDEMLYAIGMSRRENVYISNVVKCRPPKNRNPAPEEARACMPYLERQIELAQPKLIVAMGKIAATHLLQTETSISQLRQKLHDFKRIPLIATYHPAYLLRSPQEKRKAWEDCCFIRAVLRGAGEAGAQHEREQ